MSMKEFQTTLAGEYARLFASDPRYAYVATRATPEELAQRMSFGLLKGGASKDGEGIKSTCKALGIKYTYKAIRDYLTKNAGRIQGATEGG